MCSETATAGGLPGSVKEWEVLLKQLCFSTLRPAGDWFKAKDCLLFDRWPAAVTAPKPDHKVALALMRQLVNMRAGETVTIEKLTTAGIGAEIATIGVENALKASMAAPINGVTIDSNTQLELLKAFKSPLGPNQENFKMFAPAGAQKLTSDIDTATGGINSEIGVALFNTKFREEMKTKWEPATVFDYNVYASD